MRKLRKLESAEAARARSVSLGRSNWLLEPARRRLEPARLRWAGRLCYEEPCEKAIRKSCAWFATRSEHLALFVYAPSMDMLGSTLVYIYIYMYIYIYIYIYGCQGISGALPFQVKLSRLEFRTRTSRNIYRPPTHILTYFFNTLAVSATRYEQSTWL